MYLINPEDIPEPVFEFISIKDPHSNFGFANRIRYTHNEDLLGKFNFIREWCNNKNIKDVVITGDLTDSNDEKKWSFKQYFINKQEWLKFKNSDIKIWSVAGNHDMFNGMEKTDETVFGELVNEEIVTHLTKTPLIKTFTIDGVEKKLIIYGVDYSKHIEFVDAQIHKINNLEKDENTIVMVVFHSHVTPAEIAVTDFTYEKLVSTYRNIDTFICGHYHGGFPTQAFYKKDNNLVDDTTGHVVIINNWSMQRVVRDYYNEMNTHTPEFEHIKVGWSYAYNQLVISCDKVLIPCKTYDEAFKPKIIDLLKHTRKEHFEFFEKINFEDIPTGDDDIETINNLAENDKVPVHILNLAISYLNNIEEK